MHVPAGPQTKVLHVGSFCWEQVFRAVSLALTQDMSILSDSSRALGILLIYFTGLQTSVDLRGPVSATPSPALLSQIGSLIITTKAFLSSCQTW